MEEKQTETVVLGLETTCDETSVGLVKNGKIIDVLTHSQIKTFATLGGVVPQIASELHVKWLPILIHKILTKHKLVPEQLTQIAYADAPGLEGCLQVGRAAAKTLNLRYQIPLLAVNHLEAHYWIATYGMKNVVFPVLGVVISGGHSQLFYVANQQTTGQIIGATKDDAAGECIDKLARHLGIEYPGGPKIEQLAKQGEAKYRFPVYEGQDLDFSFSGLKTACIQWVKKQKHPFKQSDFAASLEEAIFTIIEKKIKKAVKQYKIRTVLAGGGVFANQSLRARLQNLPVPVICAKQAYCTDNGGMIAYLGWWQNFRAEKNANASFKKRTH